MIAPFWNYAGSSIVRLWSVLKTALIFSAIYIVVMVSLGPYLQQRLYPVIDSFRVYQTSVDKQGRLILSGSLDKNYGCVYKGFSWFYVMPNGETERALIEFMDLPNNEPIQRPTGVQNFGPWRITLPRKAAGGTHYGIIYHECLRLWVTRSVVGPLPDWSDDSDVERVP